MTYEREFTAWVIGAIFGFVIGVSWEGRRTERFKRAVYNLRETVKHYAPDEWQWPSSRASRVLKDTEYL